MAKELELLLWDEREEEGPGQRNGEIAALQSSVLGGSKGRTLSPFAVYPPYLELPSCRPVPPVNSETKQAYSVCSEILLELRRKLLKRFFPWKVTAPLHQHGAGTPGETGLQGACLIANFLLLQQHFSLTQYCLHIQSVSLALGCEIALVSSFYCHLSATGRSRGV